MIGKCPCHLIHFRYKKNIQRLAAMEAKKPIPVEQRLLEWTQFVGEFKNLENLTPHAINLSLIQYHCLDVMAFLAGVTLLVGYIILKIVLSTVRWTKCKVCGSGKAKSE